MSRRLLRNGAIKITPSFVFIELPFIASELLFDTTGTFNETRQGPARLSNPFLERIAIADTLIMRRYQVSASRCCEPS
jgi:hypothetical protein